MRSSPQVLLLIEDNPDDVLLFKRSVEKVGLSKFIHVVKNGESAQQYLQGQGLYRDRFAYPFPSLVFLDLKLPGISGFELLTWIRQDARANRVKVVVLAGSSHSIDIYRAYELGANAYLIKPVASPALDQVIERLRANWRVLPEEFLPEEPVVKPADQSAKNAN
jgi:CheY-like chemotaxis protein